MKFFLKTCRYHLISYLLDLVLFMVLNASFNNNSIIFWQSVLLVEEIEVPGENHRPAASH